MNANHDPERDAWLGAALRHAPDAQAAPPAALSDAILRHARTAARAPTDGAERPRHPRIAAWRVGWDWLARPRAAAGFASLMVATLVGLLWWDRPLDDASVQPAAPRAATPPVATAASVPATVPAAAESRREASEPAAPRDRRDETHAPARAPMQAQRPPATQDTPAALAEQRAPAPPSAANAKDAAGNATENAIAAARDDSSAGAAGARSRGAAQATPVGALTELLASVQAQPERWRWERGGLRGAMNPALQRWLLRLDGATAGRWHDHGGAAPSAGATALRLYRDDAPVATLHLSDNAVWLSPASQADLPRAAIAALRQALADATP